MSGGRRHEQQQAAAAGGGGGGGGGAEPCAARTIALAEAAISRRGTGRRARGAEQTKRGTERLSSAESMGCVAAGVVR